MSPSTKSTLSPRAASKALVEHRHYRYRGCAPDSDNPTRAAGDLSVPVTAWEAPDLDGGEPQKVREAREAAAVEVCLNCPVMMACHTYANTVDEHGRLVEPYGVRGGERALERHKRLVATRHEVVEAAPTVRLLTKQKQAVLAALAVHRDPYLVADAAGVDLRTANWQRASLVRLLGLPRDATRMQLLEAAQERGVLRLRVEVVADDGRVPAIPPAPSGRPGGGRSVTAPGAPAVAVAPAAAATGRAVRGAEVRQLALWDLPTTDPEPAPVSIPGPRLEAA